MAAGVHPVDHAEPSRRLQGRRVQGRRVEVRLTDRTPTTGRRRDGRGAHPGRRGATGGLDCLRATARLSGANQRRALRGSSWQVRTRRVADRRRSRHVPHRAGHRSIRFVGSNLAQALVDAGTPYGHDRHPDSYEGAGNPWPRRRGSGQPVRGAGRGRRRLLLGALPGRRRLRAQGRGGGAELRRGGRERPAGADHLPRRARPGGTGPVRAPAIPARGGAPAGRRAGAVDRASRRDRDRARRYQLGDHPATGRPPSGHDRAAVGDDKTQPIALRDVVRYLVAVWSRRRPGAGLSRSAGPKC